MNIFTDSSTFETLILSLKKLEQMHPNMKKLIEDIKGKLEAKRKFLVNSD